MTKINYLLTFLKLLISAIIYLLTLNLPGIIFTEPYKDCMLNDIGYIIIPDLSDYILIFDVVTCLLIPISLLCYIFGSDIIKYHLNIFYHWVFIGYIISSSCQFFTVMPLTPNPSIIPGLSNDNIISNHAYNIGLLSIVLNKCKIISKKSMFFFIVIFGLLVIAVRIHYSVDVILSFWILYFSYNIWDNLEDKWLNY